MKLTWPFSDSRVHNMAGLVQAYADLGRFSGTVLVAQGERILFQRGYGMANYEHAIPNTPQTRFGLGSLTKPFTAIAIMQLQEQGKLTVQDRVALHLPGYPAGDQITLHHLLTNTSGLPDYVTTAAFATRQMQLPTTVDDLIALFKARPLLFTPGAQYSYSNANWVLLGKIIEEQSGQPYGDYLCEHIFIPAAMPQAIYAPAARLLPGRAHGYLQQERTIVNAAYVDPSTMYAAGGIVASAADLHHWQRALVTHKLLGAATFTQMTTPHIAVESAAYGYGWVIDAPFGHRRLYHDGGMPGYLSLAARYPDDDLGIILLTNFENSAIHEIERGLAAILFNQPYALPAKRAFITVDPAHFAAYVGAYETRFAGRTSRMVVTQEAARLLVEVHGLPKTELRPLTPTRYFAQMKGEVELTFVINGSGKAHTIDLDWSGHKLTAQRIEENEIQRN